VSVEQDGGLDRCPNDMEEVGRLEELKASKSHVLLCHHAQVVVFSGAGKLAGVANSSFCRFARTPAAACVQPVASNNSNCCVSSALSRAVLPDR